MKKIAAEEARAAAADKARLAEQEKARLAAEGAKQAELAKAAAAAKVAEAARVAAEKAKQIEQEKAAAAEKARLVEQENARLTAEQAKQLEQQRAAAAEQARLVAAKATEERKQQLAVVAPIDKQERPATDLPRALQAELRRVGCNPGVVDGDWSEASQKALNLFNKHSGMKLEVKAASIDALDAVRGKPGRVCPLICGAGYKAEGEKCFKTSCPRGFRLDGAECTKNRDDAPTSKDEQRKPIPNPDPKIGEGCSMLSRLPACSTFCKQVSSNNYEETACKTTHARYATYCNRRLVNCDPRR